MEFITLELIGWIMMGTGISALLALAYIAWSRKKFDEQVYELTESPSVTTSLAFWGGAAGVGGPGPYATYTFGYPYNKTYTTAETNFDLILVEDKDKPCDDLGNLIVIEEDILEPIGISVPYICPESKSLIERHDAALETIEQLRLQLDKKDKELRRLKIDMFKANLKNRKNRE